MNAKTLLKAIEAQQTVICLNRHLLANLEQLFKNLKSQGITQKAVLKAANIDKSYFYRNRQDLRPSEAARILSAAQNLLFNEQAPQQAATA